MNRPNIVLITFDSLRADHCGYWGYNRNTTPNLDKLAKEGVVFTNAVSPASRTNPSMAGIFTGEPLITRDKVSNPEHSKFHLNRHGTVAEELSEQGYATAAFCPNAYSSRYYGFDRGFDKFEDFLFSSDEYQKLFNKHVTDSSIYTTIRNIRNLFRKEEAFRTWDTYIDDMEEWAMNQDSPYFLWAFSLDTHFPYITPRKQRKWSNFFKMYYYNWRCHQLLDEYDIEISDKEKRGISDIYDDSIRFADNLIGELQERLGGSNTVFVVCADHGEALGERDVYGHFYPSLYEENIHIPLVIGGNIDKNTTIKKPVPLTKLPKIIRRLSRNESLEHFGQSIVTLSTYDGRRERNLYAIRTKDWKYHYIRSDSNVRRLLYDLSENEIEPQSCTENEHIKNELEKLSNRKQTQENEIMAIRECASSISD